MTWLIDGYNLLHALGVIPPKANPKALDRARDRLLRKVIHAHRNQSDSATIVFDAKKRLPPGVEPIQHIQGIEVIFAIEHDEADDFIEERIRTHSAPRQLSVVSDDRRLQQAARRRRCQVMKCEEYIKWMESSATKTAESPAATDKKTPSDKEQQQWLDVFGDLDNDPAMKELFDPFNFDNNE